MGTRANGSCATIRTWFVRLIGGGRVGGAIAFFIMGSHLDCRAKFAVGRLAIGTNAESDLG